MEYNVQEMIFQFIGGLGIFLFGIKYWAMDCNKQLEIVFAIF
ncbi:hypothetical protein bcere0019_7150 [Bacillus cereus Rock3-28]|nr:hypothetical protein bcere0019_7150 [Bacillus cereus Rock3-28]